ncbi:MAG: cobalamin-binding protein [Nitrososphaera sp.]|nr:cobalamin-binding protein [Nitrososphaera sp.]
MRRENTHKLVRIVSFLPSATETLFQLGAGSSLVGVTHECKYPAEARKKTQVIRPSFNPSNMTGREIDSVVVELVRAGGDIYVVDEAALKKAQPDLIVAQGMCEVCAPFTKEISRAVNILTEKPQVLVLDPHDLDDILISIMDVAEKIGRVPAGRKLVASLQKRIDTVRKLKTASKPKVLCVEWLDPLFTAGHWVPQMVEYAGGVNGISSAGEPSRRMRIEEAIEFDPDVIVLMPCGFSIGRTMKELPVLIENDRWKSLAAVRNGNVYAVDAGSYFSKPGPRTIVGLEIMAKILHPEASRRIRVPRGSYKKLLR